MNRHQLACNMQDNSSALCLNDSQQALCFHFYILSESVLLSCKFLQSIILHIAQVTSAYKVSYTFIL